MISEELQDTLDELVELGFIVLDPDGRYRSLPGVGMEWNEDGSADMVKGTVN